MTVSNISSSPSVAQVRNPLNNGGRYPSAKWPGMERHIRRTWKQGEHLTVIGPTGCGKTTFLTRTVDVRDSVVVFVTKIHDDTITQGFPASEGWERITKWPPPKTWSNKLLLWPDVQAPKKWWSRSKRQATIREAYGIQRRVFKDAFDQIFTDRNWCVVIDEQHYTCKQLGLDVENAMLLQQGRSSGLSVVNGTQRPAWVPVVTYSSASHAVVYRTTHRDDLKRLSELGGVNMRQMQANLLDLDEHEFIYVNTRAGDIVRSQVDY